MNLNNSLRKTPVAVIGISALFADAKNVEEFWTNIIQAKDSITDVPASRWSIEDYYDPDMRAPDKTYCKRGGFLPDIDFNPMEFGLPPNILEVTDASQLLGLVAARDALEDAGYGQKNPKFTRELKDKTGVLLGVGGGQKLITPLIARLQYPIWEKALRASGIAENDIPRIVDKMKKAYVGWNENSFPGLLGNVISGRITNRFDLGGINSVVDAACAASLSAIKMALSELVEGRADMMLTGGVDTDNSPFMYMSFSKTPAFSKSGNISPFSDKADGMLIGEGLGMIVLKRLEDAERDGDQIYAVIKGIGTSSDGRFKSVYAPRSSGQAMAIERAYEEAGYDPKTVGLLEAHGTGTGAGDPTEFNSMQMVFGKNNPVKQHIALGSVKSQIGHTKAAAGAAGIIKTILALHHKVLPPTINVEQPNSKFDIENSAIYINTAARPWMRGQTPRRASVSAFGFGGINVHIALEEYSKSQQSTYRIHQPYHSILLNANTPAELLTICQNGLQSIETAGEKAFKALVDSSNKGAIGANQARLGFVTTDAEECKVFLTIASQNLQKGAASWEHPKGIYFRASGVAANTKVAALFSGQGSQYVGMGKEITNAFPPMLNAFTQIDAAFEKEGKERLTKSIFPIPVFNKVAEKAQQLELTKTQNAQPAIGTLSMGLYKILQQSGFKSDFTAGHSFGELTALWAADVYDDATFLALAKARGAAMAATNPNVDTGTMLAVKAPLAQVEQAITSLQGVTIANVNSTNQIILGGSNAAIANATTALKNNGFSVVPLPVSAAFHTEFVGHAQKPFATFVANQKFNSPQIPVYSNTTSTAYPNDTAAIQNILQGHILKPVLFKNQIENMYQAGARIFVEFGPKGVLTNLVKDILKGQDFQAVALNANARKDSDLQLRQAAIQLRVIGVALNEIDIYKKPAKADAKMTKLNVKLGGHNYVSAPTKKAYTDVMNDGFRIQGGGTTIVEKPVFKEVERIVEVEKFIEVPVEKIIEKVIYQNNNEEDMNKETLQLLQNTVEHFKTQQTKSLELFERFLSEQNQQSQQLISMLSQQLGPVQNVLRNTPPSIGHTNGNGNGNGNTNGNGQTAIAQNITPTFPPIVEEKVAKVIQQQPTIEVSMPAPAVTQPTTDNRQLTTGIDKSKLENILLTVISEKTGYPAEMLELSMDMEADLGIDSIKRVEIFGAMTEDYPEVNGINPNDLTELRTLGQIVDYLAGKTSDSVGSTQSAAAVGSSQSAVSSTNQTAAVSEPATRNPQPATGVDKSKLEGILLTVISEKTGYPAEMLELSMDMEADLGIDSIKRVEIFGAMTEDYPEVNGINPNDLTELRTLGQIVDYLAGKTSDSVGSSQSATAVGSTQLAVSSTNQSAAVSEPATGNSQPETGVDESKLEGILLTVISEKTGYPAEMLELSMDMEADLGIDSIKRVEIFGAMTEDYPEVNGINPNDLTELRTLGQIVDYLAGKTSDSVGSQQLAVSSQQSAVSTSVTAAVTPQQDNTVTSQPVTGVDKSKLEGILLTVISEKTGYPAEMLELSMDMEADLGIDSIKRVEIFGAMTEDYPEVNGINPNDLTELRTLGQIVDYLAGKTSDSVGSQQSAVSSTNQSAAVSQPATGNSQLATGTDKKKMETILLTVISEKTGYPAEMLELSMDMEADLGIDSIKRVEIFGAMTEDYPEVNGINPNDLTELRTLGQIVDYISQTGKKKILAEA